MRILIDDGMQIKVGTGIGKYSLYLYKELKKHLEKKDSVELLQFDKGSSSKKQGRLKYASHPQQSDLSLYNSILPIISYPNNLIFSFNRLLIS